MLLDIIPFCTNIPSDLGWLEKVAHTNTKLYMQDHGFAETEFSRYDMRHNFKAIFGMHKPAPIILSKGRHFIQMVRSFMMYEEDVFCYTDKFKKTCFIGTIGTAARVVDKLKERFLWEVSSSCYIF
jgi:hypothetical protein